jgi:hypothetical protein
MNGLKEIDGFDGYYAHPDGNVYSDKKSNRWHYKGELRLLKPKKNKSGYLYYGLFYNNGTKSKRAWIRAHKLIYNTFIGEIPDGVEIDHYDDDRHNNSVVNLQLLTHSENILKAHRRKRELKQTI